MTTAVSKAKKCASAIWIYPSGAVPDPPLTLAAGDSRAHLPNMPPPSRGSPPSCHSNSHQPWLPGVASPVTAVAQLSTRTTAASRPWSWFHWHQLLGQLMRMEQWNCFGTNSRKPCHCSNQKTGGFRPQFWGLQTGTCTPSVQRRRNNKSAQQNHSSIRRKKAQGSWFQLVLKNLFSIHLRSQLM